MALCEKCKVNPASVQIIQIMNGKKEQRLLCQKCAQEENLLGGSLLSGIFNMPAWLGHAAQAQESHTGSQERTCHGCGLTFSEFLQTGFLGCPECYQEFSDLLQPTVRKIQHGNEIHRGIRPSGGVTMPVNPEVTDPVELLKRQLDEAIRSEEYERAAQLRDEIRTLTKEASHG